MKKTYECFDNIHIRLHSYEKECLTMHSSILRTMCSTTLLRELSLGVLSLIHTWHTTLLGFTMECMDKSHGWAILLDTTSKYRVWGYDLLVVKQPYRGSPNLYGSLSLSLSLMKHTTIPVNLCEKHYKW